MAMGSRVWDEEVEAAFPLDIRSSFQHSPELTRPYGLERDTRALKCGNLGRNAFRAQGVSPLSRFIERPSHYRAVECRSVPGYFQRPQPGPVRCSEGGCFCE
jgi:hypothetical protein